MKKTVAILVCAALLLSLAACANTPPAAPAAETPQAGGEQATAPAGSDTAAPTAQIPAAQETPDVTKCMAFNEETPLECDLDSDGTVEKVEVQPIPETDGYLAKSRIVVTAADGSSTSKEVDIAYFLTGYACDVSNDGCVDLFVCGDMESCDYSTWLLNYQDGKLIVAASPYDGENNVDWLPPACSGSILGIENGIITVEDSIDILGTWGAKTQYTVSTDPLKMTRVAGSVWTRDESMRDPAYWDYCMLITTRELPVTFDGESTPSTLEEGVKIATTETDYESYVSFVTEDGRTGRIAVTQDTEYWGWRINEVNEAEYFETVPYAG